MNAGRKITLFSVGAIGSALLLTKFLSNKPKKKKKIRKKQQILQQRKQISIITESIMFTPNGDHTDNLLYSDEFIALLLPYLTTFSYLNTFCILSKYHYLYLHHNHIKYNTNKYILFNMLLNESNQSWNIDAIERVFGDSSFVDIYHFMYSICNDWKYDYDETKGKTARNKHLFLIESMICVPFIIPNINMVKYWFSYISNKTFIPIRHLSFISFKPTTDDHKQKWNNYFVSALEYPYECNLFLWIIIYNLYQLNIELNKEENKYNNIIHSNYFGFEHKLQEWLVFKHLYTFLKSDISALLKLYNMIINTNTNYNQCFLNNMVYILCIMFKVIFHNTELHIVRLNASNNPDDCNKMEWKNLERLFLNNLYNVTVFIQYVVQINNNNIELFKTFKSLLKKSNIKMVKNILIWFQKVNHHANDAIFYTPNHNTLSLEISPIYWSLMGLNLKITDKNNVAITLLPK